MPKTALDRIAGWNGDTDTRPLTDRGGTIVARGWQDLTSQTWSSNHFQLGLQPTTSWGSLEASSVFACVSIIAQEIARLHIQHLVEQPSGGFKSKEASRAVAVLRNPNEYQTRSDFWLTYMAGLLTHGNAYAVAIRDSRGRIRELHCQPPLSVAPRVGEGGKIFYGVATDTTSPSSVNAPDYMVPARDVMHRRLITPRNPLVGVSPVTASQWSILQNIEISKSGAHFFANQSRYAGVLKTEQKLTPEAIERMGASWNAGGSKEFAGKTAVLDRGVEFQSVTATASDSQMAQIFGMSVTDVCRTFRIPKWMLGDLEGTSFRNVESMQRAFVAGTLGFYVDGNEAALDRLFKIPPTESLAYNLERGYLKSDFSERMKAFGDAITGGVMTPNEVRNIEGLEDVEGGDKVYLQKQMTPTDILADPPPPPVPIAPPVPGAPKSDDDDDQAPGELQAAQLRLEFADELVKLHSKVDRIALAAAEDDKCPDT